MKTIEILVVDDDPLTTAALKRFLLKAGYRVSVAKNGVIALKKLNRDISRYQLIILDQMMPLMSGLDLLNKLSTHRPSTNIPIIMLTGKAERADQTAAYTAGAFDFLAKPIDADLLRLVVERALNRYQFIKTEENAHR